MIIRYITIFVFLSLVALTPGFGMADETYAKNYGAHSSVLEIGQYSRLNSQVTVTYTGPNGGNASATLACVGGYNGYGGWAVTSAISGQCQEAYTITVCDPNCHSLNVPANIADASDVDIVPFQHCGPGFYQSPDTKKACFHNYSGGSGLSANTGDDMFRLDNSDGAFFEYEHPHYTSNYRLQWMRRDGGLDKGLMVPSGPPGNYSDFQAFSAHAPSFVEVQPACYPARIALCENSSNPPRPIPVDGICGSANGGSYATAMAIPTNAFCNPGDRTLVTQSGTTAYWQCTGRNGGRTSPQCSATTVSPDAFCGSAHLDHFAGAPSSGLCAAGTVAGGLTATADGWRWWCDAPVTSGTDSYCAAFRSNSCQNFHLNNYLVLVQDTSVSFADDFPNIKKAFFATFNNPAFSDWRVGISEFNSVDAGGWRALLNFSRVGDHRHTILNIIQNLVVSGSEDAFYGIQRAIPHYQGQLPSGKEMTILLVTDEGPSGYDAPNGSFAASKAAILNNNVHFIAMTTSGEPAITFQDMANQVGGTHKLITTDSSNMAQALLDALITVNCQ